MKRAARLVLVLAAALGTQAASPSFSAQEPSDEKGQLLERAARKMEEKDYAGALEVLESLLSSSPPPIASFQAGVCRTVLGRYAAALDSFRQAEKGGITGPELWSAYGIAHFQAGDHATSRSFFERVLASQPGETTALFHLGRMELASGLHADAESKFRRVLEKEPGHTGALFNLGQSLILQGKDRDGRQILELHQRREHLGGRLRTLQDMASSPRAPASVYAEVGNVYVELGDLEKAMKAFGRAEELAPGTPLTGLGKGKISYSQKDFAAAEKHLAGYWNQVERSCEASLFLGLALKEQKKVSQAREILDQAYQKCPRTSFLLLKLGQVEIQAGHLERAGKLGEAMLQMDPQDPSASFLLAVSHFYSRDLEGAERRALKAVGLDPRNPEFHRLLAAIYRARGEPEKASTHERRMRLLLSQKDQ